MNAKERREAALKGLETVARFNMGLYTYDGERDKPMVEDLTYWESKGKAHKADEGEGWALWKLGKG